MKTSIKRTKHPEWVEEMFRELDKETIERMVKTTIYQNVVKTNDRYRISDFFQNMSNRVENLDKNGVLEALKLTELILCWKIAEDRGEVSFID